LPPGGSLEGRRALVTGGGRGIGRAIALALADAGADVAVAARSADQVARVAAAIEARGRRALALAADVTTAPETAVMAEQAAAGLGGIDILVNSAGAAESAPVLSTDEALWRRMLETNLTSVFLCTRALLPPMVQRGWGRVINVASSAGLRGHAYVSAYCAAKHGVVGFTRAVALELAGRGVTINALCPGYVDTEMTRRSVEAIVRKTGKSPEEVLARLAGFNRTGRLLSPDEVAEAALRLAGEAGAAVNGEAQEL